MFERPELGKNDSMGFPLLNIANKVKAGAVLAFREEKWVQMKLLAARHTLIHVTFGKGGVPQLYGLTEFVPVLEYLL